MISYKVYPLEIQYLYTQTGKFSILEQGFINGLCPVDGIFSWEIFESFHDMENEFKFVKRFCIKNYLDIRILSNFPVDTFSLSSPKWKL